MALADLVATVTVSKGEYEALVRTSERMKLVERYLKEYEYGTITGLRMILNVKESKENE